MGAVGSIELMVAMAVAAIATFNLKKSPWHLVFSVIIHCLGYLLPKRTRAQISDSICLAYIVFVIYFK